MKKAANYVIIINGDNNKLNLGESKSRLPATIAIALGVFAGTAVLTVSHVVLNCLLILSVGLSA